MKRFLLSFFALLSIVISAQAQTTFEVDGIYYSIQRDPWEESPGVMRPGEVYVTKNESGGYKDDIVIPATVTYTQTYKVIGIGSEAFKDCTKLTSVTIKEGVTSIGWQAFKDCSKLASVTIPNSVTTIEDYAFENCSKLASVTLGDQLTQIGGCAFYACTSLSSIIFPNSLTQIAGTSFAGCESLESITIPNGVTRIGERAFEGCTKLASVNILSDQLTKIEWNCFQGCTSLTSINIPNSVTKIESSAFYGCSSLTSITIPDDVTKIESSAFNGCSSLTSIIIPDGVTKIEGSTFSGCTSLTSIIIPDGVTKIEGGAFSGCTSLTSINIPDGVTKIEGSTFSGCTSLSFVEIPNSITIIGDWAFSSCTSLLSITIPSDVVKIENYAFNGCNNLKLVTSKISTPIDVNNVFDGSIDKATLVVPKDSRTAYKNMEGWKNFAVILEEGEKIFSAEQTDAQGIKYSLKQAEDYSVYYSVTGYTDALKTEIVIPDALDGCPVKTIEGLAFNGTSLISIIIPNSVTSIGSGAFNNCSALKLITSEITEPFDVDAFDGLAYQNATLVVPNGKINDYKGKNGWNSFDVIIEDGGSVYAKEQTDEQGIFYRLRQTADGSVYYSVTGHTEALKTEIVIPASLSDSPVPVKTIEGGAFNDCSNLTSVTIPGSVSINSNPFYNCASLKDVVIVVTDYAEFCNNHILGGFDNPLSYYDNDKQTWIYNNITVHLKDKEGKEITDYVIPEGVTAIGGNAFKGCANISSITIPSSVTSIGQNAFNYCASLTSITIPSGVTSIGDNAFYECNSVKLVTSKIAEPIEMSWSVFGGYKNNAILVVPKGKVTAYQQKEGWNGFAFTVEEGQPIYDVAREQTDAQGLKYTLRQGEDYSIYYALTDITDVQKTEFVIPTELEGCPVRAIERCNFFQDCKSLTTVTIPGSVKIDCGNPFYGCMKLKDVYVVVQDYAEFCNNKLLGTIENPSYYYDGNTGESTTITYTLHITDNAKNEITDYIIPEGVTTIGKAAFKGYTALSSITIPSSVTSIGDGAFYGCSGLELVKSEISTPFDVKAFEFFAKPAEPSVLNTPILIVPKSSRSAYKGKSGWDFACIYENGETIHDMVQLDKQGIIYTLRQDTNDYSFYYAVTGHTDELDAEIVIPAELDGCPVKAIEGAFDQWSNGGAFKGCNDLTSVKIGKNVTSIGGYAFYGCTSLESITLPKKLESIGDAAFSGEWSNSDYMNHGCAITSIAIPGTVKTIGNEAFSYCRDLATVSFGVDEDGNANLTSIGDYAFRECTFTSIIIPNSVTTIGKGAFMSNGKLTTVTLGDAVKEIKDETFQGCSMLASVTIPDGVSSIGVNAFRWCYTLTSVRIPSSLTSMGELAFEGCPLKSIELPDAFTTIPDNLFKNNNLGYIKLGNNVQKIGKNAFGSTIEGNDGTIVIEIGTSTPPTIAKDAFPNLADMLSIINVIVPDEASQTAYGNASVWKDMTFANMKTNVELTVDQQGNIGRELYDDCKVMPAKVVGLKVKGSINADDFQQMRSNFKSLLRLDLSECDITEIPDGAMYGKTQLQELTLPTSLQTIGNKAFMDCPYLTGKLDLPSGVTSIGNSAFEGTNYTSVTLPNKLKTIGNKAFYNLPIKQKLTLPDALTSIGDEAFAETQVSGYVEMPNGMTYLGNGAFRNTQIESTALPDDPKGITSISWGLFQGCTNFKPYPLYIPGTYTRVEAYAFDGCSNLSYVRMSPNLESIGEYAFQNTQVEYLKVPSKVENLPTGVFKNCKSLESLSLPANLKQVGPEALYGCSALRNLSVEATTPPTAERNSLLGVNTDLCLISIPTTSFYDYLMADYWGQFVQMRNDIAVETEGNGEIAFESVDEEEEALTRGQRFAAARARTRAAGDDDEDDMQMTFANNGSSILIPKGGKVRFVIIPAEAETLISATLDGEDITSLIDENGIYTTTADKESAKLVIKFSGSAQTDPSTDPTGETSPITIGKSGKASYCGDKSLDFSFSEEVKAYIATGFDESEGTIWLTRVKDVPAGTPVMIKGVAEKTYDVPVTNSQNSYYKNMFKGNTSGDKIQVPETENGYVNYYLSGDGTFKSVKNYANIGNNKSYLQLPGTFKPAEVGGNQAVTIKSVGKTSYAAPVDLDFTNVQGLKAFTATGYDKSTKTIWLTRVMKVQKGEGVLLKGDEGDYQIPSAAVQSSYMNMFVGNTSGDKIQVQETSADGSMTNFYLKGDGTFVSVNGYVNLGNNKCYLELPTSMVSVASTRGTEKSYKFEEPEVIKLPISFRSIDNDGDGTTAIHETMQSLKEDGVYYTLQGQRVEKPGKGIYIKNGKKVVIR